jgi:hypothetical protein
MTSLTTIKQQQLENEIKRLEEELENLKIDQSERGNKLIESFKEQKIDFIKSCFEKREYEVIEDEIEFDYNFETECVIISASLTFVDLTLNNNDKYKIEIKSITTEFHEFSQQIYIYISVVWR